MIDQLRHALESARALKSEDDGNPEYDRALIELIWEMFGVDRARIANKLGIPYCGNCGATHPGDDLCRECGADQKKDW